MDEETKICPECGAEYYAHVSICKGCDIALVSPGEKPVHRAEGQFVCIMEGDTQRIKEIANGVQSTGIDCKVLNAGGGSSCSSGVFGIFVQQSLASLAAMTADKVKGKLYPELFEAEERLSAGLCPACGAKIGNSPSGDECPDCGLNLSGHGPGGCNDACGPC